MFACVEDFVDVGRAAQAVDCAACHILHHLVSFYVQHPRIPIRQ